MLYLTGCSTPFTQAAARYLNIGVLCQPATVCYVDQLPSVPYKGIAMDNGCYGEQLGIGEPFDGSRYLFQCDQIVRRSILRPLFATAPDVIGSAELTLERSYPYLEKIRGTGMPVALVGQPGMERMPLPWSEFDVLFLGGDDAWKDGSGAAELTRQAQEHAKPVHMGRVNTLRRARIADRLGIDTIDGTGCQFGPDFIGRVSRWPGIALPGCPAINTRTWNDLFPAVPMKEKN